MITGVLYDENPGERDLLEAEVRFQIALHSEDESSVFTFAGTEEFASFLNTCDLLDFACVDVCGSHGTRRAEQLRQRCPQVSLLIVADPSISPMSYIRPSIMPLSIILRPSDEKRMHQIVMEFMTAWMSRKLQRHTADEDTFLLETRNGMTRIPYQRIGCFEASMKKVFVRLDREEFAYYDSLDALEQKLPAAFVRCHRGFIVNAARIRQFLTAESLLVLDNGMRIPVSRSYKNKIRDYLAAREEADQ